MLCHAERFQRTQLLLGDAAMTRLAAAHVTVCGLGGVGSYAAEAIARAGIGALTLVDFDEVAASNINRQLCALTSTVGQAKADVVAARVADINPDCQVTVYKTRIAPENAAALIADTDYLADAIDDIPAKLALLVAAKQRGLPVIAALGAGRRLDPTRLHIADISETSVCPLARIIRRGLRQAGVSSGLRVVYSSEPPLPQPEDGKQPLGSVSFVPAVMGLLLASVVVRELAGIEIEG